MKITVRLVGMLFLIAGCISCKTTRSVSISDVVTYWTDEGEKVTVRIPEPFKPVSGITVDSIFHLDQGDKSWLKPPVDIFYADSVAIFVWKSYFKSCDDVSYARLRDSFYPSIGWEGLELHQGDFYFICPYTYSSYDKRNPPRDFSHYAYLLLEKVHVTVVVHTFYSPDCLRKTRQLLQKLIRQMEIDPGNAHPRSYKPDRKEETPQSRAWKQYKKRHR